MDSDRHEDSGEMYSPDDHRKYTQMSEAPQFSVQGLSGMLAEVGEGTEDAQMEEYAMMLEVTMADRPPAFSWNAGMVMHILKSNPMLRELEHMQVDRLGMAYLLFYNKQDHRSLGWDTVHAIRTHMEEAFSEWISCSAHFTISLLPSSTRD